MNALRPYSITSSLKSCWWCMHILFMIIIIIQCGWFNDVLNVFIYIFKCIVSVDYIDSARELSFSHATQNITRKWWCITPGISVCFMPFHINDVKSRLAMSHDCKIGWPEYAFTLNLYAFWLWSNVEKRSNVRSYYVGLKCVHVLTLVTHCTLFRKADLAS